MEKIAKFAPKDAEEILEVAKRFQDEEDYEKMEHFLEMAVEQERVERMPKTRMRLRMGHLLKVTDV
jgi:hypothetical protein